VNDDRAPTRSARFPAEPISRFMARFLHVETASGIVLLLFALAAVVLANSPASERFLSFWQTPVGFSFGSFEMHHSLKHWINDGLMVIFFFVIGLEVKREMVLGELRELRTASLPMIAALGGMLAPAALYLSVQWGQPGQRGWGIPVATDIAFVVGCLAALGRRVPHSLRILLLSLAIADDIGAILVIAMGYSHSLHWWALGCGVLGIGAVILLARIGVRSITVYALLGVGVWLGFHESGVHATIAGVILGLLTPAQPSIGKGLLAETLSPLERLETALHPWVSFGILPLFAFANAGVPVRAGAFANPVAIAVILGLMLGKPIGITLFSWLAVRTGLSRRPADISWGVLAAGGVLAGIGFTMSLFITGLALEEPLQDAAKVGILSASTLCAAIGTALLLRLLPRPSQSR